MVARNTSSGTRRRRRHSGGAGWPPMLRSQFQSRCPRPSQGPRPLGQPARSIHGAQWRLPSPMLSGKAQDVSFPGPMHPLAVSQAAKLQAMSPKPKPYPYEAKSLEHSSEHVNTKLQLAPRSRNPAFWNRTRTNPVTPEDKHNH